MTFLIHITPQLPPAVCGVGDYATVVGSRMEELVPEVFCHYLATGPRALASVYDHHPRYSYVAPTHSANFWRRVEETTAERGAGRFSLILHYTPFGYARNGLPRWLAAVLRNRPGTCERIIAFFHEYFYAGPPWRRSFWRAPGQRQIAAEVAQCSDAVATHSASRRRWLAAIAGKEQDAVAVLPVPSNVGEPKEIVPWKARADLAIAFGNVNFHRPFLSGPYRKRTAEVCRKLGIRRIRRFGARNSKIGAYFHRYGIAVDDVGFLPADEVSGILRQAKLFLLDTGGSEPAKSGVLAAAAAHGVPLLMGTSCSDIVQRLGHECGWEVSLASKATTEELESSLAEQAIAIFNWYGNHTVQHHAEALLALIGSNSLIEYSSPKV